MVRERLVASFTWRTDPWSEYRYADDSEWWRHPEIVAGLGACLAGLNSQASAAATVVMGTESRGFAVALLVAAHLGIGVAEVRKEPERASDDDRWLTQLTVPDYQDRHLELALRRSCLRTGDRVLFVDDWIETGAQAVACRQLVSQAGAVWLGAHVMVDGLTNASVRRELGVARILHRRDL